MNFKSTLIEIKDFLTPYEDIWYKEILHHYPSILDSYDSDHLNMLFSLSDEELWKIDARVDFTPIKGTSLLEQIEKTLSFNDIISKHEHTTLDLPSRAFTRVKEKKHHEFDNLIPLIEKIKKNKDLGHVVDIGGGVGHLSRILGCYFDTKSICVDYNPEFLAQGKRNINKLSHPNKDNTHFFEMDVKKTPLEEFNKHQELFNEGSFIVGLHSCGPLSTKLLKTAQ